MPPSSAEIVSVCGWGGFDPDQRTDPPQALCFAIVVLFQLIEGAMRKPITAVVAAAALAAALIATPKPAEARCWGCWAGAGIAAGLITGAVIASSAYGYGYGGYGGYGYGSYYGGYGYPAYGYAYAPVVTYAPPAYYGGYMPYPYAYYGYGGFYRSYGGYYGRPYYARYSLHRYYHHH
jgi:hypothetical protein